MRFTTFIYIAGILAAQLMIGLSAGYIGYMRGIQKADALLATNWYVLLPLLGLALLQTAINDKRLRFVNMFMLFVMPSFVLIGFVGAYKYPVWNTGLWYSVLSGALTSLIYVIAHRFMGGCSPLTTKIFSSYRTLYPLCCLGCTITIFLFPLKYQSVNVLSYYGQGLLNDRVDDTQFSARIDGMLKVGYLDGWEVPTFTPDEAQFLYGREGRVDVSRRYWLRGIVLELFGLGYWLGDAPPRQLSQLSP